MKHMTTRFLASLAMFVAGGSAFGQYQQVSHCDCDGSSGSYVGYQATDWNHCDSCQTCNHNGRKHRRNDPCNDRRGLRNNPISRCIQTKAYPDSGWAPPLHYPVNYDGVWYGAYHPQAFYGSPGGGFIGNYPTVYQPNDTTQLGCIYHKVPTWQTRTDMIPPTPFPGNFHNRGYLYGSYGCFGSGHHGGGYHGGYSQPCQACQSGYVTEVQPVPNQAEYVMQQPVPRSQMQAAHTAPQRTPIVRPAAKKSGFSGLRLASLTELFD